MHPPARYVRLCCARLECWVCNHWAAAIPFVRLGEVATSLNHVFAQLPTDHFAGGAGVGVGGARPRGGESRLCGEPQSFSRAQLVRLMQAVPVCRIGRVAYTHCDDHNTGGAGFNPSMRRHSIAVRAIATAPQYQHLPLPPSTTWRIIFKFELLLPRCRRLGI